MSITGARAGKRAQSLHSHIGFLGENLRRLTLVEAPAGHDKTEMLTTWTETQETKGCEVTWVSLGPNSTPRDLWPPIHQAGGRDTAVVVVDNYENVGEVGVDTDLAHLLNTYPNLHLIVSGRSTGTLAYHPDTARFPMTAVRAADLRLTPRDWQELRDVKGQLSQSELVDVIMTAGGWPRAARALNDPRSASYPLGRRIDKMLEGLFETITDPLERRILQAASLRPGVSTAVLKSVVGAEDSDVDASVERLSQIGLLIPSRGVRAVRLALPGRFATSILAASPPWLSKEQRRLLLIRHADEVVGADPLGALALYVETAQYDAATELLLTWCSRVTGLEGPLLALLNQVPDSAFEQRPRLSSLRLLLERRTLSGSASLSQEHAAVVLDYEGARVLSNEPEHSALSHAFLLTAQRTLGLWEEAEQSARNLHWSLEELADQGGDRLEEGTSGLYSLVAGTTFLTGNWELAEQAAAKAAEAAKGGSAPGDHIQALSWQALTAIFAGHPSIAKECLVEARGIQEISGITLPAAVRETLISARMMVDPGTSPAESESWPASQIGWRAAPLADTADELWSIGLIAQAALARRGIGPYQALRHLLNRLRKLPAGLPLSEHMRASILLIAVEYSTLSGRQDIALDLVSGWHSETETANITYLRALLFQGSYEEVVAEIPNLKSRFTTERVRFGGNLMGAAAAHKLGDEGAAVKFIAAATSGGRDKVPQEFLLLLPYEDLVELAELHPGALAESLGDLETLPSMERPKRTWSPTAAEREVLDLMAKGFTTQEIALALSRSVNTVKSHERSLLLKLGAKGRALIVMEATNLGFLSQARPMVADDFLRPLHVEGGLTAPLTSPETGLPPGIIERERRR